MKKMFIILCAAAIFLLTACPSPSASSTEPEATATITDLTPQDVLKSIPLPGQEMFSTGNTAGRSATIGDYFPVSENNV